MTSEAMRRYAELCLAFAERATSQPVRLRYMRMAVAWQDLAENQEWLDGADRRARQQKLDTAA